MKRIYLIDRISDKLLPKFKGLNKKLLIAGLNKRDVEFMDWVVQNTLLYSLLMAVLAFIIVRSVYASYIWVVLTFIVFLPFYFYYFMHYPDVYIYKRRKLIEYDIVFATKHLIIELSSGMPLFDSLIGVSEGYGEVSKYFRKIVDRVTLGEPITHVLRDMADKSASPAFKRILIQIANSVTSGADVAESLTAVINQISQEQILSVKEYGQKLNPVIMFYLIVAVIFPTLGITFMMILFSFVSKGMVFPLYYLILISFGIGLIQFLFLAYVESARPKYALLTS